MLAPAAAAMQARARLHTAARLLISCDRRSPCLHRLAGRPWQPRVLLSQVDISTAELAASRTVEGWFPMVNKLGRQLRGGGRLRLKLWFEGSNAEARTRQQQHCATRHMHVLIPALCSCAHEAQQHVTCCSLPSAAAPEGASCCLGTRASWPGPQATVAHWW